MALFDNGESEEFFFVRNFNMTLMASKTLAMDTKVQYLCTIVCGESPHQVDSLSDDVECTKASII